MLLHVRLVRGWSRVDTLYLYYFKCKNRRLSNVHISSLTSCLFSFFLNPSSGLSFYLRIYFVPHFVAHVLLFLTEKRVTYLSFRPHIRDQHLKISLGVDF